MKSNEPADQTAEKPLQAVAETPGLSARSDYALKSPELSAIKEFAKGRPSSSIKEQTNSNLLVPTFQSDVSPDNSPPYRQIPRHVRVKTFLTTVSTEGNEGSPLAFSKFRRTSDLPTTRFLFCFDLAHSCL